MSRHRLLDLSKFPDCSGLSENGKCTRKRFLIVKAKSVHLNERSKKILIQSSGLISDYLTLISQHKNISPKNIMVVPCRGTEKNLFDHIADIRG